MSSWGASSLNGKRSTGRRCRITIYCRQIARARSTASHISFIRPHWPAPALRPPLRDRRLSREIRFRSISSTPEFRLSGHRHERAIRRCKSPSTIAAALNTAINANATLQANNVSSTVVGAVLTISQQGAIANATQLTDTVTGTGNETVTFSTASGFMTGGSGTVGINFTGTPISFNGQGNMPQANSVCFQDGYRMQWGAVAQLPTKISTPDLDRLIEKEVNAGALLEASVYTAENAKYYDAKAAYFNKAAGIPGISAAQAAAYKSEAERNAQYSQQIRDYLAKGAQTEHEHALANTDLTPAEKEARANNQPTPQANATRSQEIKQEVEQSQKKTYNGINAASSQYDRDLKPYLDLSKSILNQPDMYSGTGANLVLDFNRVRAALGDQKAAVLQEALSKVTAASVLGQINTQKDQMMEAGGTAGRIFAQQVGLVEKAAPALSNTVYGNRFLVNVASRMGEFSTLVAQQARDYIRAHGHLDTGFDQQISNYLKSNPVFTPQELKDPRTLGAPDVPDGIKTPQQLKTWEGKMGLKSGDPFRIPGGGAKYVP